MKKVCSCFTFMSELLYIPVAETGQLLMFLHVFQSSFINRSFLKAHPSCLLISVNTSSCDGCFFFFVISGIRYARSALLKFEF